MLIVFLAFEVLPQNCPIPTPYHAWDVGSWQCHLCRVSHAQNGTSVGSSIYFSLCGALWPSDSSSPHPYTHGVSQMPQGDLGLVHNRMILGCDGWVQFQKSSLMSRSNWTSLLQPTWYLFSIIVQKWAARMEVTCWFVDTEI